MLIQGAVECGQLWPAVIMTSFTHPVLRAIAERNGYATDLFCWVAWFDPQIKPLNGTTRPLNLDGHYAFVNSLINHYMWYHPSVPAYPLMCAHCGDTSIESAAAIVTRTISYVQSTNSVSTEYDSNIVTLSRDEFVWRLICPPEVACGLSG